VLAGYGTRVPAAALTLSSARKSRIRPF